MFLSLGSYLRVSYLLPVQIKSSKILTFLPFSFIFLVVVVLMNLLNGLAVSDTGLIRLYLCSIKEIVKAHETKLKLSVKVVENKNQIDCFYEIN
jgi:hypothetical protein